MKNLDQRFEAHADLDDFEIVPGWHLISWVPVPTRQTSPNNRISSMGELKGYIAQAELENQGVGQPMISTTSDLYNSCGIALFHIIAGANTQISK